MSSIRILAGVFALAFAAAAPCASVEEVHGLLIQEHFDQADAMAQEMLASAKGTDKAALQQRLAALNLLIDSAEVQHKLGAEQVGTWIENGLAIGRQLYGEESRSNARLLAAQANREHQLAATDKALGAHSAELIARALDWEAHRKGELATADVAFVYRTAYSLAFGADTPKAVVALAHADQILSHPQTDWERRWHAYQLGALGDLQITGEHPAEALAKAREGVALAERVSGRDSIFYGGLRFSLAQALFFTSDYQGARESIEPAVEVFRKHPSAAPIYLDASLSILGDSLLELGDYDSARQCFTEMIARLKLREPKDASSAELYITALNDFGALEQTQDHTEAARDWFRQEIAAVEALKAPGEDRMLIVPLASLGDLEVRAGNTELADDYFRRAAEWVSKENEVFFESWVRLGQARVSLARGDAKKAEELLSNAIARSKAAGGERQVVTESLHCERALAQARLGQPELAFQEAAASEKFRLDLLSHIAPALGEDKLLSFRRHIDEYGSCAGILFQTAAAQPDAKRIQALWEQVAGARNQATRLQAVRLKAARQAADPKSRDLWLAWENAAATYGTSVFQRESSPQDLSEKRAALEQAEARLSKQALAPNTTGKNLSYDAMLQDLPPHSVLVAFAEASTFDTSAQAHGFQSTAQTLYALVTEGKSTRLVALGDSAGIEAKVSRWLGFLRQPASDAAELAEAGRAVRAALWDPLAITQAPTRVLVVPDGPVFRVNFSALPDADGYLVERGWRMHMLESEQDLALAPDSKAKPTLLAIGSPDFGDIGLPTHEARRGLCTAEFAPLPGTEAEVERIAQLWYEARHTRPEVLKSAAASKEAFRRSAGEASVIHVATHAFQLNHECTGAADSRSMGTVAAATKPAKNGFESALALAGANKFLGLNDTSGVLTSDEVVSLPLDRAQWVVLAACDTGLGAVVRGEGVFGLRRAFRLAGAKAVVMSLWEVDDKATSEWMSALYGARLHGSDTPESVAQAQLATIATRRARGESTHPFFWSAFIASGDWH